MWFYILLVRIQTGRIFVFLYIVKLLPYHWQSTVLKNMGLSINCFVSIKISEFVIMLTAWLCRCFGYRRGMRTLRMKALRSATLPSRMTRKRSHLCLLQRRYSNRQCISPHLQSSPLSCYYSYGSTNLVYRYKILQSL